MKWRIRTEHVCWWAFHPCWTRWIRAIRSRLGLLTCLLFSSLSLFGRMWRRKRREIWRRSIMSILPWSRRWERRDCASWRSWDIGVPIWMSWSVLCCQSINLFVHCLFSNMGAIAPLRISVFLSSIVAMYLFESIVVSIKRVSRYYPIFNSKHRFSVF